MRPINNSHTKLEISLWNTDSNIYSHYKNKKEGHANNTKTHIANLAYIIYNAAL